MNSRLQSSRLNGVGWACVAGVVLALPGPAWAYKELGGKWDTLQGPVEYTISSAGSDDIADNSEIQAIQYAFRSWECVLCSNLQFLYTGDGPNEVAGDDGKNALFFLETAQDWQSQTGAGVDSVLGVCIHHDTSTYSAADIAFNGTHTWSTSDDTPATDVESIAVHEIGHFLGLGHSCTDDAETDCLPASESVMNPAYPGGNARALLQDDQDGICAIYPTPKETCSGKKRLKEQCDRDCDCERNLVCIPDGQDKRMCSRGCGRMDDPPCPTGTACALGVNSGGEVGVCIRNNPDGLRADGTVCTQSGPSPRCASGECARSRAAEKIVCANYCAGDGDCAFGYVCSEGMCLLPSVDQGVPCPKDEEEEGGCPAGCTSSGADTSLAALLLLGVWRVTRRRHG